MKTILNAMAATFAAIALAACALLSPLGADDEVRYGAKVALAAYETTQQAILIYGRLPACDAEAEVVRFCRDRALWAKIKAAEKAAVEAIVAAEPVLNATAIDAGQIAKALAAIATVNAALREAQAQIMGPRAPRGST
jgi:hypothetical protein